MIEVRIPNEIKKYKETWYFGLNTRQLICVAIAIGLNAPLQLYCRDILHPELLGWITIITGISLLAIGFFEYNNMKFEKFLWTYLKFKTIPQLRLYKTYTFHEFAHMQELKKRRNKKNV
jgi:hypothetical protein